MATSGARIEISNLTKKFGSFTAVDDLSFVVEPGRITRVPRSQRCRQDDNAADGAGPGPADVGQCHDRRSVVRRPRRPDRHRGSGPGGDQLPPRPLRARPPAGDGRCRRRVRCEGGRAARADRDPGVRATSGGCLLDGDAAATGAGGSAPRRPACADPGRTGQRAGSRRHPLAAGVPLAAQSRGGQDDPGLQPPAPGGRPDGRRGRDHRQRDAHPPGRDVRAERRRGDLRTHL